MSHLSQFAKTTARIHELGLGAVRLLMKNTKVTLQSKFKALTSVAVGIYAAICKEGFVFLRMSIHTIRVYTLRQKFSIIICLK